MKWDDWHQENHLIVRRHREVFRHLIDNYG